MSEAAAVTEKPERRGTAVIAWLVPVLSILWLAGKLWAARGQIRNSADGGIALSNAAYELPGVVQATIIAGIGVALLATLRARTTKIRYVFGAVGGILVGALTALLVGLAYPHLPSIGSIEAALVVSGLIGGVFAASPRVRPAVIAGLAGAFAALIVSTIMNSKRVNEHMLSLFNSGNTPQSDLDASKLVQYVDYALYGLIAGIVAFVVLRRFKIRSAPLYVLAGATHGLALLVTYGVTQIGGHRLLDAADALSAADKIVNTLETQESIPNALIVLFVGALAAMIAYGRTLKPASATAPKTSTPKAAVRNAGSKVVGSTAIGSTATGSTATGSTATGSKSGSANAAGATKRTRVRPVNPAAPQAGSQKAGSQKTGAEGPATGTPDPGEAEPEDYIEPTKPGTAKGGKSAASR